MPRHARPGSGPGMAAAPGGRPKTAEVSGFVHNSSGRRLVGSALSVTLLVCLALLASCAPSVPGPAAESFKKEVQATKESLAPSLMDAVSHREPGSAKGILERDPASRDDGNDDRRARVRRCGDSRDSPGERAVARACPEDRLLPGSLFFAMVAVAALASSPVVFYAVTA